jgi:hypothetical protein
MKPDRIWQEGNYIYAQGTFEPSMKFTGLGNLKYPTQQQVSDYYRNRGLLFTAADIGEMPAEAWERYGQTYIDVMNKASMPKSFPQGSDSALDEALQEDTERLVDKNRGLSR